MCLALAASKRHTPWKTLVIDVARAFLNATLAECEGQETVYVEAGDGAEGKCWVLHRALYGLRGAPCAWQNNLRTTLMTHGWEPHLLDASLYIHPSGCRLVAHVDDLLLTGPPGEVDRRCQELQSRYKLSVEEVDEKPTSFLGRELRKIASGFVWGVDGDYITKCAEEWCLSDKPCKFVVWEDETGEPVLPPRHQGEYRKCLGQLAWVDRADVRVGVIKAAMMAGRATETSMRNVRALWQYLRTTRDHRQGVFPVEMAQGPRFDPVDGRVIVFTDADHSACKVDGRSVSGLVVWCCIGGEAYPIVHSAKKQGTVSLSSGEAELTALVLGVTWALGAREIWHSVIQDHVPSVDRELVAASDSSAAIKCAKKRGASQRTRHYQIKMFYLQSLVRFEWFRLEQVAGENMIADVMTKVNRSWSDYHMHTLGMLLPNSPLRGVPMRSRDEVPVEPAVNPTADQRFVGGVLHSTNRVGLWF